MEPKSAAGSRRAPAQKRGQERIDAILDAASKIIAERGYEALTLTAAAERSGSAIGSLYRFFASKEQLEEALAVRIATQIADSRLSMPPKPLGQLTVREFVDWYVAWIFDGFRRHPALSGLLDHAGPQCKPLETVALARFDAYFKTHGARMRKSERLLASRMALEIVSAGIKTRAKLDVRLDLVLAHVTDALTGYIEKALSD